MPHSWNAYSAILATRANQPGWDIKIDGPDGHICKLIQAKATDSVGYVKDALNHYPHIDVVTTSEVYSHLVMQGLGDRVADSGITNVALNHVMDTTADGVAIHMHYIPSVLSLALIAFSSYSVDGLSAYEKSRAFGMRAGKSYVALLVGGALAVMTHTWIFGVAGSVGSRLYMGSCQKVQRQIETMKHLIATNELVLDKLRKQQQL